MGYLVRVKICGITNEQDLESSVICGADAIGFNFFSRSPRSIDFIQYHSLINKMPISTDAFAVFVDKPLKEINKIFQNLKGIKTVQVHCAIPEILSNLEYHYVPAFSVKDERDVEIIMSYLSRFQSIGISPFAVLLDGHCPTLRGGSGIKAPWNLIASVKWPIPIILAGGLRPDNVAEAIEIVRPWAVDVASGVEAYPGKKDRNKIEKFIQNAKEASAKLSDSE